ELGDERDAVEVIVSALLEIEHAREANDENEARGNAVDAIGRQELPRARGGELAAQQREFHGERRHQRERGNVVQKREERRQPPSARKRSAIAARSPRSASITSSWLAMPFW